MVVGDKVVLKELPERTEIREHVLVEQPSALCVHGTSGCKVDRDYKVHEVLQEKTVTFNHR